MKILFIALSLILVLSFVACDNNKPEVTDPKESTSEPNEIPSEEPSETPTEESSEELACQHVEETVAGKAATCTEPGLTEGKKCSLCGETLVAQEEIPALGHTEEVVPGKAATCTEAGLTEGKKCSLCGETLVAQEEIPAGHTEEVVPGKAATCTDAGLTEGKKCSVCGETLVEQNEIPAINHANKIDKAFAAPTTAEDGWLAHTACPDCGKAWDAEGNELEAIPTLPKLTPATEVYLGVEELKNKVIAGAPVDGNPSQFNAPEVSADRTYVRFSRAGASQDGNVMLLDGNTAVTGNFFVLKYRTDHMTSGEFWANTTENGHSGGKANFNMSFINDSEWHIMIVDLSKYISSYIQADGEGKYTIQWSRIDLLNSPADKGYFDIAYAVYCDDLSEVASALQEGDNALCPHYAAATPVYANEGDKHSTACAVCGAKSYENHYAASSVVWSSENKCYTGTCICGAEVVSDMIYKTEGHSETNAGSANNFITATKEDGFIRYTATKEVSDSYFYPYRNGTAVTGKFMVIKYRMANNGVNAAISAPFAGSAAFGKNGADGQNGDSQNYVFSKTLIADGEWHYLVVTPKEANASFTPNADGTYSWGFFRIKVAFAAFDSSCYVDIAEIAFADNQEAAEYYAYKNDPQPPFRYNFDQSNNEIDGVQFLSKSEQAEGCLTLDMSGKTLTTPTSLVLGGWNCTPGGVDYYYIRVTKIDGAAVEAPELVKWQDGGDRSDIYNAIGKPNGYTEASGTGAGFNKTSVDLTAWAGHTIDLELVAVTNYGATVVFGNFQNLAVPAAQAQ